MKKKLFFIFTIAALTLPVNLYPAQMDTAIAKAFEKLVESYNKQYPAGGMKKGLAVLPIEEKTETAKSKALGTTVREIVAKHAVNSRIFYLVDRDTLEQSLEEMKISMTGLVDDASITRAGKLIGVQVFITGTIAEIGSNFNISLRMVDAETGKVVAMETIEIPGEKLLAIRKELAYETIEQYGLGINLQTAWMFVDAPETPSMAMITDIYVNYRPFLWLNFKAGATILNLEFDQGKMRSENVFPLLADDAIPYHDLGLNSGRAGISETTFLFGVDYNLVITEWLNLAFGATFNHFETPMLNQILKEGFVDTNLNGAFDSSDDLYRTGFRCIHHFNSVDMIRFEFKPQVIIIPRLTLGLAFGYTLATKFKTDYSEIGDEIYSAETQSGPIPKYFGMSTNNFLGGKNVEDIKLNGSYYLGMNVNFFF